ncbi:hypothetical protein SAMN04488554_1523 [Ruania alba]|uniref:Uncharacterized protein n=1 Tax=Ruania alba TaxID=648782 RepID=A0A1H5G2R2_9MICO|nr:hypothetical protein SAMN04488554_1523 [Ruania alba]
MESELVARAELEAEDGTSEVDATLDAGSLTAADAVTLIRQVRSAVGSLPVADYAVRTITLNFQGQNPDARLRFEIDPDDELLEETARIAAETPCADARVTDAETGDGVLAILDCRVPVAAEPVALAQTYSTLETMKPAGADTTWWQVLPEGPHVSPMLTVRHAPQEGRQELITDLAELVEAAGAENFSVLDDDDRLDVMATIDADQAQALGEQLWERLESEELGLRTVALDHPGQTGDYPYFRQE